MEARETSFGEGEMVELVRDEEVRRWESLYIEARKG